MKNKLRKIAIDNLEYLYIIDNKYHLGTDTNTLTVKVYLSGKKQTPLVIEFLTPDHYYMGQILNSGVNLLDRNTNAEDIVNINEPKYIRALILLGRSKGWTGTNKIDKQNGLIYLEALGYDADTLLNRFLKK